MPRANRHPELSTWPSNCFLLTVHDLAKKRLTRSRIGAQPTTNYPSRDPASGTHDVYEGVLRDAYRGVMVDKFEDLHSKGERHG